MAIAVPTGIKIFNWLATMWGGKIHVQNADAVLHRVSVPVPDRRLDRHHAGRGAVRLAARRTSYFVVAHFHYVIVGGILFAFFGGFYYWFPKMSGKMYSETLGKWHFWLFLIGFHLTFDFMHVPGLLGMPRTNLYLRAGPRLGHWNLIVTVGVVFQARGILVFVFNLLWSYFRGAACRERSVGRLDAGMVHQFAAARLQLRV